MPRGDALPLSPPGFNQTSIGSVVQMAIDVVLTHSTIHRLIGVLTPFLWTIKIIYNQIFNIRLRDMDLTLTSTVDN